MSTLNPRLISVLDQDRVWTANGYTLLIDEMTVSHKRNTIAWLERQAGSLGYAWLCARGEWLDSLDTGEMTADWLQADYDAATDQIASDPLEWLRSTKLLKRLVNDIAVEVVLA